VQKTVISFFSLRILVSTLHGDKHK